MAEQEPTEMERRELLYHVVFEYTEATGNYAGVRTWTSFPNKTKFDEWHDDDLKSRQSILEEGVTEEHALLLVRGTPLECDLAAAVQEATT